MARSGAERWLSTSPGRRIAVLVPLVLILDVLLVIALGLQPLGSISGLRCDALLRGGEPKPDLTLAPMIQASSERLCQDASNGRRNVLLAVGAMVLLFGAGAVLTPADRLERALVPRDDYDDDDRWEPEPSFVPSYAQPRAAEAPATPRSWLPAGTANELPVGDAAPLELTEGDGAEAGQGATETEELPAGDAGIEPVVVVDEVDEAAARKAARAEKAKAARARAKAAKAPTAAPTKAAKATRPAAKVVRARPSRAGTAGKAVVSARPARPRKVVVARSAPVAETADAAADLDVEDAQVIAAEPGATGSTEAAEATQAVPVLETAPPRLEDAPVSTAEPLVTEAAPVVAAAPTARRRAGDRAAKRVGTRLGTRRPPPSLVAPSEGPDAPADPEPIGSEPTEPVVLVEPVDVAVQEVVEPEPEIETEPEAGLLAMSGPGPEDEPSENGGTMPAASPPRAPRSTKAERAARSARAVRPVATTRSRSARTRPSVVTTPFDEAGDDSS